jgi:hypothetical protein
LFSSVLEQPAPSSATVASSNTMKAIVVFMAQACNAAIALWQPQAYNVCPNVAQEIAINPAALDEL